MSTHATLLPVSARHEPATSPTYPVPTTAIFIEVVLRSEPRVVDGRAHEGDPRAGQAGRSFIVAALFQAIGTRATFPSSGARDEPGVRTVIVSHRASDDRHRERFVARAVSSA